MGVYLQRIIFSFHTWGSHASWTRISLCLLRIKYSVIEKLSIVHFEINIKQNEKSTSKKNMIQAKTKTLKLIHTENIRNILWNTLDRKGNFPQWDLNPMPLVCQMSALTARPQRIPNLSQITYPSDSCVITELWPINYLHSITCTSHPCIGIYHCASVLHICLDGLPSSK